MTGEQYYRAHHGTAVDLGIEASFEPWENVPALERQQWEELAFYQTLRDRGISDRVLVEEGM